MWKGAADALKPRPVMIIASPTRSSVTCERSCAPTEAAVVEHGGEGEGGDETAGGESGRCGFARRLRDEHGDHQAGTGGGEQRQRGREREPVDRRARDRGDHFVALCG